MAKFAIKGTAAFYEGAGDLESAQTFVHALLGAHNLAEPWAIDVGWVRGQGWAVVEANAAWGSGLNGCDPYQAIYAINAATVAALRV